MCSSCKCYLLSEHGDPRCIPKSLDGHHIYLAGILLHLLLPTKFARHQRLVQCCSAPALYASVQYRNTLAPNNGLQQGFRRRGAAVIVAGQPPVQRQRPHP